MMRDLTRLLPQQADATIKGLPFGPDDLLARLVRVKLLSVLVEMLGTLSTKLGNTLLVERADLMRMADIVMTEIEATLGRPSLDAATRTTMQELAQLPLNIWQKWLDRLQQTHKNNDALRAAGQAQIDAANQSAAAAGAVTKIVTGTPVTKGDVLLPGSVPAPVTTTSAQRRSTARSKGKTP